MLVPGARSQIEYMNVLNLVSGYVYVSGYKPIYIISARLSRVSAPRGLHRTARELALWTCDDGAARWYSKLFSCTSTMPTTRYKPRIARFTCCSDRHLSLNAAYALLAGAARVCDGCCMRPPDGRNFVMTRRPHTHSFRPA